MTSTAFKTLLLPAILALLAFIITFQFVDPPPPKKIVFTTGDAEGAYHAFAKHYQRFLQEHGIEVVLQPSEGSVTNIERLQNKQASVGFVQGGVDSSEKNSGLESLGSLYYEPLWVFFKKSQGISHLPDLSGGSIYVGNEGSGSRALALQVLKDNETLEKVELVAESANPLDELLTGQLRAVFMVASASSASVREMLENPDIQLMNFSRAEAYQRRLKFLSSVTLPRGMVSLSKDLPAEPKTLLAATANLVVREDLHPAIQDLLLQAAAEIHTSGGWFESHGEFPSEKYLEYPLSSHARRFYQFGPPLLQRYLPFRFASLIDRLKVMMLPLIVLMIPLMKIMPPIYTWRMRSKIYRWYQELERIDLEQSRNSKEIDALRERLDSIEQEVIHVHVPLSFASQLYDLRQHIELVKRRLV